MTLPTAPPGFEAPADPPQDLPGILALAVQRRASDVHVRVGSPVLIRVAGELVPLTRDTLDAQSARRLVEAALPQGTSVEADQDFALELDGVGRFRANAYQARGCPAMVLRHVRSDVPRLDALSLPSALRDLALLTDGLVLVCGPTGSGKSTTLAAMVDVINDQRACHVLTIEDPIEFLYTGRTATISQREIHTDTPDFAHALRSGLRQDPDVIVVGEARDLVTVRIALQAAETGHLVLASLHARSVADAVTRIVDLFPPDEQRVARASLAEALRGVVCQRLAPSARPGGGVVVVTELGIVTGRMREALRDSDRHEEIAEIMADGDYYGMHTFEQDAVRLVMAGDITVDEAEKVVANPSDLHVALRRAGHSVGHS